MSHSWLVWLSLCSGWDKLPELSKEPGWPPTPSPPARSYHFAVVKLLFKAARLCPSLVTRVIKGHAPNPNFLRKTANKSFLVLMPMAKDWAAACVFGPCDWPRHRSLCNRRSVATPGAVTANRKGGSTSGFFCKLHSGERLVDGEIFILGCTCPFKKSFITVLHCQGTRGKCSYKSVCTKAIVLPLTRKEPNKICMKSVSSADIKESPARFRGEAEMLEIVAATRSLPLATHCWIKQLDSSTLQDFDSWLV